ncbi:MAG: histidinol-phosphate transaminase [Verrucomicrobia bacterium]|nr:histidinol-phosphate transaminase [Verrucomicrobiota bacterium]
MSSEVEFNPCLATLPVYQPGRPIEEVARELGLEPGSIIKLASNENPLGPSRRAVAAMRNALGKAHLYPDGSAFHLKQKLATHLGVTTSNLVLGNGSNEVLEMVGHAMLRPGTGAVVSQYCFAVYPIVTALSGAALTVVPARNHGHDLDAMLAAIRDDTRVVFVANPNNPTGTTASPAQLESFIQAVPSHVLIVLDEAYIEFLDGALDLLPGIRDGSRPNLLLVRTFSKIHGLAGIRLGYGIGHPDLIAQLEKVREPFNVNAVAQAGAVAALDDQSHAARTRKNNQRGLKLYSKTLKKLGLEYVPSTANFVLVRVGDGLKVFSGLQKLGVITRPMAGYQLPEWIRISIGTSEENERCLAALTQVLGLNLPGTKVP